MRMIFNPLVVKPIVDHWRPAFEQEDSRRFPPMADKLCHFRSLSCLGMGHEDYERIGIPFVEVQIGAGNQLLHEGWN